MLSIGFIGKIRMNRNFYVWPCITCHRGICWVCPIPSGLCRCNNTKIGRLRVFRWKSVCNKIPYIDQRILPFWRCGIIDNSGLHFATEIPSEENASFRLMCGRCLCSFSYVSRFRNERDCNRIRPGLCLIRKCLISQMSWNRALQVHTHIKKTHRSECT